MTDPGTGKGPVAAARTSPVAIAVALAIIVVGAAAVALVVAGADDDDSEAVVDSVPSENTPVPTEALPPTEPPVTEVEYPEGCTADAPASSEGPRPTVAGPPEATVDPDATYTARIVTTCGDIVVALDASVAPTSVGNFAFLAREGFYDGLTWHRAAAGFVIQGGDPAGDGSGGPGYSVVSEAPPEAAYPPGALAWAKAGPEPAGTAGSQFFVVTGEDVQLPPDYGWIGQVIEGLDVARAIASLAPATGDGPPALPVWIDRVEITEG